MAAHAEFEPLVRSAGLGFACLAGDARSIADFPRGWRTSPRFLADQARRLTRYLAAAAVDLIGAARQADVLLLNVTAMFGYEIADGSVSRAWASTPSRWSRRGISRRCCSTRLDHWGLRGTGSPEGSPWPRSRPTTGPRHGCVRSSGCRPARTGRGGPSAGSCCTAAPRLTAQRVSRAGRPPVGCPRRGWRRAPRCRTSAPAGPPTPPGTPRRPRRRSGCPPRRCRPCRTGRCRS